MARVASTGALDHAGDAMSRRCLGTQRSGEASDHQDLRFEAERRASNHPCLLQRRYRSMQSGPLGLESDGAATLQVGPRRNPCGNPCGGNNAAKNAPRTRFQLLNERALWDVSWRCGYESSGDWVPAASDSGEAQ
eukprot:scaffold2911_cov316-Pinguiococcus_pyrenoidosus.AAC.2